MWTGEVEAAEFTVECLRDAPVGIAQCVAHIIQGSEVTHVSFVIEVVETSERRDYEGAQTGLLDTRMAEVEANVAVIDHDELEISATVIGRGNQVGMGVATKEAKVFRSCPPYFVRACVCVYAFCPARGSLPRRRPF